MNNITRSINKRPGITLSALITYRSISIAGMKHFRKKWLAIYGVEDRAVPTDESVRNISHYMSLSGNKSCNVAIIPRMGHVHVDSETKRRVMFDYLIINWLDQNIR